MNRQRHLLPICYFHVNVISDLFKKKFLAYFKHAYKAGQLKLVGSIKNLADTGYFYQLINELYAKKWVTYCRDALKGPKKVLKYLGRYTHRVAISNHRLVAVDENTVTFKWKDYKDENKIKLMRLDGFEFIRRFLLHILPHGFFKIRHYRFGEQKQKRQIMNRIKAGAFIFYVLWDKILNVMLPKKFGKKSLDI